MQKYTRTAVLLHWLIAILIVAAFILGLVMTDIPGITPKKLKFYSWHKWMGMTVLALAAIRLLWRLKNPVPTYPPTMPAWQVRAAGVLHGVLYVMMFAVPITGYLYTTAAGVPVVYLGLVEIPSLFAAMPEQKELFKEIHETMNWVLFALVIAHVAAALKHAVIDKDGVMRRMLP